MNVPVVDSFIPKVLAAEPAIAALPGADYKVRLADWVRCSNRLAAPGCG